MKQSFIWQEINSDGQEQRQDITSAPHSWLKVLVYTKSKDRKESVWGTPFWVDETRLEPHKCPEQFCFILKAWLHLSFESLCLDHFVILMKHFRILCMCPCDLTVVTASKSSELVLLHLDASPVHSCCICICICIYNVLFCSHILLYTYFQWPWRTLLFNC